jgi:hypothetical protein
MDFKNQFLGSILVDSPVLLWVWVEGNVNLDKGLSGEVAINGYF